MYKEYTKFLPDEILVYLRKSRSDDPSLTVEEVLEKHESIIREWIENNLDGPIPEENYYREVVSGETIAGRPEVQKLLRRMESPKYKAVLCVEVQRISRGDLEDCGRIMKLFRYTHTKFITPYKIYDLEDEYDRDGFERELKRGNEYLEYTKKILQRGIKVSIQNGNFIGPTAPYGYKKTRVVDGKKKNPTLEIVEDEAKVVRMIFDWYANEQIGASKIADRLNNSGIQPRIAKEWKKSTIIKMLDNELYIGKIREGIRTTVHRVVDQEIIKAYKYNLDYTIHDGQHDAIVDEELFFKAKNRKGSMPKHKRGTTLRNPFATILRCKCGSHMELKYHRNKWRFICANQNHCRNASVLYDDFVPRIIEIVKKHIDDLTVAYNASDENEYDKHNEYISLLESKLNDIEQKEISLWETYSEEGMPKNIFDKLRTKYENEKKSIETAIAKAYNEIPEKIDYGEIIFTLHEVIDMVQNNDVSAESKNKFLKTAIEKITYSRNPAIRMTPAEAEEKGIKTENGWYMPDFEVDMDLYI